MIDWCVPNSEGEVEGDDDEGEDDEDDGDEVDDDGGELMVMSLASSDALEQL